MTSLPTPREPEREFPTRVARALRGFNDLSRAADELIRAQLRGKLFRKSEQLEGISFAAAELLLEGGVVRSIDEGVVLFHERITVDKPGLRAVLRASDVRSGRLQRLKQTKAQRAYRQALKAGMVNRGKDGRLKGLNKQGKASLARIKRDQKKKRDEARKRRETSARGRLKGLTIFKK